MADWRKALDIEQKVAAIIFQQELNGVQFNLPKARKALKFLRSEQDRLYRTEIRPHLSLECVVPYKVEVNKPFLKNGSHSKMAVEWMGENVYQVGGPFTRIEFVEPDIGSRKKLIKQLLRLGWKPKVFTDTGQPKLTHKGNPVDTLLEIENVLGKAIAKWYTYGHRASQIEGWVRAVRPDGRIAAGADSCGTNTARMRHRVVVNVPKADPKVIFGYEMRDLFIAADGHWLIGHDAAGLEARMMAHYTHSFDGGEFGNEVLHGDVHSKNARIFFPKATEGLEKGDPVFDSYRSKSKNGFYALVYGAQPPKLADTLGVSSGEGQALFDAFWRENTALGQLREKVLRMAERGWVPGLDGRKIYIRSPHSALNALFQSAGAIVMKYSMVILDHWVKSYDIDGKKVWDMHDESGFEISSRQVEVYEGETEESVKQFIREGEIWMPASHLHNGRWRTGYSLYGEMAVKSIIKAGTFLNLRCPLDAEYKIGHSWAEVH